MMRSVQPGQTGRSGQSAQHLAVGERELKYVLLVSYNDRYDGCILRLENVFCHRVEMEESSVMVSLKLQKIVTNKLALIGQSGLNGHRVQRRVEADKNQGKETAY